MVKYDMKKIEQIIIDFLCISFGATIAAFAIEEFLVPNQIFDGGVIGIAMIIEKYIPLQRGLLVTILNIPFVVVGWKRLGSGFMIRMFYAVALFSAVTYLLEPLHGATYEIILAVTFGGVLLGTGVGLVLRGGGCLDGTEIVATILNRNVVFSTGQIILLFNVVIFSAAGVLFGADRGMYSLLMYFITSKIIDLVEVGTESTKSVMIITEDGSAIAEKIYTQLGRTVTFLQGTGLVSSAKKDLLYCVVTRAEIYTLKKIISSDENSAFTTISEVSEIVGNHIKSV